MRRMGAFIGIVIVILLGLLISGTFYTVSEWDQVVVTQFGRPLGKPKTEAGLRFKIPVIQEIHRYEKRIMRWDGDPKEIPTRDKRFIYVDTTARWRVVDAQKFLEVLGTYTQAYAKLDDIIDAVLRDYVSANPLVELVRTTNEMPTVEEVEGKVLSPFQEATAPETWNFEQLAVSRPERVTHVEFKKAATFGEETGSKLREEFAQLADRLVRNSKVLLDFAGVTSFSAASLEALVLFKKKLQIKGSRLALCCLDSAARECFFVTRSP